ncbi:hypothetical protein EMIHUDRAFT_236730 [Emiliania huxleyi CCMP1516]|uniref:Uncharacterized protein n=2 Tax=Emiliania huxleyi TaxID=2903 RepID=A0A0D3JT29_EMIH1|nr:hypothetical protein EMIHUDRAFT_236730 [Emiliania huxleyi CCMP1516]EOD26664.1 hypothetical protein EMIHUDRAFT_236730 [Emiliania huxleyi CCMP1516]|eukprot:XP_005779093.1 hypothetical protein EMIHUDRAFT_236730 [Emiliania huxleyi CCMP1516]
MASELALAEAAAAMPTPEEVPAGCLLHMLLSLLLQQPPTSLYLLGLASCVHKWVQASAPAEQRLVASHPGFVRFASPLRGMRPLASLGLAPPEPVAAAAAGMTPKLSALRRHGPLADAARGSLAQVVTRRRVELARALVAAASDGDLSVETMCVINAAILFFLLADLDGRGERGGDGRCGRVSLLDAVCEASGVGASAGEEASEDVPALSEEARSLLEGFGRLLRFWGEVYHSHSCERRFLEFSSGVPFPRWLALVAALREDIRHRLSGGGGGDPANRAAAAAPADSTAPRNQCVGGEECECALGPKFGRMGICVE